MIDIGSNSVLCLVAAGNAAEGMAILADLLETTRLGSGLRDGGPLDAAARGRTLRAVAAFAKRAHELGARDIVGIGTAALRAAVDGAAFAREIAAETGVPVSILSGMEEARLAYAAVACAATGPLLAVDVGGRSTELVLGEAARVDDARSLALGALVLTEELAPALEALAGIRDRVASVLAAQDLAARARSRGARLVASGGTATALASLDLGLARYDRERVHGHVLDTERLVPLALAAAGGGGAALDPGRRRILPAGAVILEAVARAAGAPRVGVSDRGIRHARAEELLAGLEAP